MQYILTIKKDLALIYLVNTFYTSTNLLLFRCCLVAKLCWTLCDTMDCSMLGFPVLHYLQELAQTHVH